MPVQQRRKPGDRAPLDAERLDVHADGSVALGGERSVELTYVARLTADGVVDAAFGDDGVAVHPGVAYVSDVVVDRTGRILASSRSLPGDLEAFFVARLQH